MVLDTVPLRFKRQRWPANLLMMSEPLAVSHPRSEQQLKRDRSDPEIDRSGSTDYIKKNRCTLSDELRPAGYILMSSDQATTRAATIDPKPDLSSELKARIRNELADQFTWPASLAPVAKPLHDLSAVMDLGKLSDVAAMVNSGKELSFAIISKEYIQTGLNWIHAMQRLDLSNFIIIAGDRTTSDLLDERDIPNVLGAIDERHLDASFLSSTGFSAKGLAVSAFKLPVTLFLVKSGYSVVLSDADAVWLRDPMPYLRGVDIAFQRIVYHPPAIASQWGFAACGGFNFFRSGVGTIDFLERCVEVNQSIFDDQVVINLALLEGDPYWHCESADWTLPASGLQYDRSALEAAFVKCARYPIKGNLQHGALQLLALPHDKFWRHTLVTHSLQDMVICHPNSPKDDLEKMKLLDALGLQFNPGAVSRP